VIPESSTLVVPVIGLDVLGQPLDPHHVHRPELVASLAGAALGDPVTPAMLAAVLAHPEGGGKAVPQGARLVPFLNKADDAQTLAKARTVASLLLAYPVIDSVLIGTARDADPVHEVWNRTGGVILAAGQASRYGSLKQVISYHGVPLVAYIAGRALACPDLQRLVVTVGAGADRVEAALTTSLTRTREAAPILFVHVSDWGQGQSRSVQAGLRAIQDSADLGAVLFLLADQPGISPELLSALVQRHRETLAPIVAPRYDGQRGNPVLFDRITFPEFEHLGGDIGARPILQAHQDEIAWVEWPTPEIIQDIDTVEDYRPDAPDA
jgi:molybdenum cofactor cytidylyltransferase